MHRRGRGGLAGRVEPPGDDRGGPRCRPPLQRGVLVAVSKCDHVGSRPATLRRPEVMNMSGRTFAPALNVMVEQPAVLAEPDLSLAGLLTRFPGLAKVDAVGLTGSVAAGFGNALSDIDLFVFA